MRIRSRRLIGFCSRPSPIRSVPNSWRLPEGEPSRPREEERSNSRHQRSGVYGERNKVVLVQFGDDAGHCSAPRPSAFPVLDVVKLADDIAWRTTRNARYRGKSSEIMPVTF